MIIKAINVGRPQLISNQYGQTFKSGIRKKSVQSVLLHKQGFDNDGVADLKNHGGEDRAVCFYPFEHYSWWDATFGKQLTIPAFGENATVTNMLESEVCVGDIYKMGDVLVQITQGRIPCSTIDRFNQANGMFNEVIRTGKTGFFAKVLEGGVVEAGTMLELQSRPHPDITIAEIHRLFFHARNEYSNITNVLLIPELAEAMKEKFQKLLPKEYS
ncbi:MOSC domain-containing protein [Lederbergia citrea]|uniref:MOSC domain-containing protein n=1 Tax=Lederbergia citrea TaxID=2833581 RepID=A0A942UIE6_9BACI|nr:MOSC domain-containing protein [Lederbergia citrea]MBS4222051.1 MOSC domain-containing protein [Lederbergia citrea]